MARQEEGPRIGYGIIFPLEEVIDENGNSGVTFGVMSNQPDGGKTAQKILENILGGPIEDVTEEMKGGKRSFFFSSSQWHAPWNPPGPKKNWISQEHPEEN